MSRRVKVWLCVAGAGLVLLGLGIFFVVSGLDRADKLASVVGAFAGLIGLGLSVAGGLRARSAPADTPAPGHTVSGTVKGDNIQIGPANDVRIERDR